MAKSVTEKIGERIVETVGRLRSEYGLDFSDYRLKQEHFRLLADHPDWFGENDFYLDYESEFRTEAGPEWKSVTIESDHRNGGFRLSAQCPCLIMGPWGWEDPRMMVGSVRKTRHCKTLEEAMAGTVDIMKEVGILKVCREESRDFVPAVEPFDFIDHRAG